MHQILYKMQYYNFSGKTFDNQLIINIKNRAFRYADSLFESMYFTNNKIVNLDKHWERFQNGIQIFKMNQSQLSLASELEEQCIKLIQKNDIKGAARIRLQIFRKGGGLYLPESNDNDYIIEVSPLKNSEYILNDKGLKIGIAKGIYKDISYFSEIKTSSKQEMILAAMQAKENDWDDAIILNSKGKVVESSNSNIFIVKGGKILTPPLKDGPINGIMRQSIIECTAEQNIEFIEKSLTPKDLDKAEELFISNSIRGIQWIEKFESKHYENNISAKLVKLLNSKYIQ